MGIYYCSHTINRLMVWEEKSMDFVFFPVLYLSYFLASLSILLTFEKIELQELIYIGGDALVMKV